MGRGCIRHMYIYIQIIYIPRKLDNQKEMVEDHFHFRNGRLQTCCFATTACGEAIAVESFPNKTFAALLPFYFI